MGSNLDDGAARCKRQLLQVRADSKVASEGDSPHSPFENLR
jgi:hypothetical protein